ncbi:MAG: DNA cytosine methyltransferase, partial [Halobacteriota archaeon]|nr:DNA cytosine methyltransferase [Halobacteriota archaeon]
MISKGDVQKVKTQLNGLAPTLNRVMEKLNEIGTDLCSIPEETEAALTHFLQLPAHRPPLMTQAGYSALLDHLEQRRLSSLQDDTSEGVSEHRFAYLPETKDLLQSLPYPPPVESSFRFIDLFAGIGGFRIAFQEVGGRCVFSSEWDRYAQKTYAWNFGEMPYGDIRRIPKEEIPDHDVL